MEDKKDQITMPGFHTFSNTAAYSFFLFIALVFCVTTKSSLYQEHSVYVSCNHRYFSPEATAV